MAIMFSVLVFATSAWVFFDAKAIGVKKGQLGGVLDMTPEMWALASFMLWIVAFPAYLMNHSKYAQINETAEVAKRSIFYLWAIVLLFAPLATLLILLAVNGNYGN